MKTNEINKKISSKRRYIITAVIFLILIISALVFIWLTQEKKTDPASEKIIREVVGKQLNKDPNELTDEDFAKIEEFRIFPEKVEDTGRKPIELSDIRLFEKFANLKVMSLNYIRYPETAIPNWMKTLAKTGFIDLNKRYALDLSPIKGLINLRELNIIETPISDIEPLKGLINLQELGMIETHISDLSPLIGLKKLQKLDLLYETHISDIEPLRGLTDLKEIVIHKSTFSELDPLKELTNLRILVLYEAEVSDLSPLKKLTNLQELAILNSRVTDLSNLETLKEMMKLRRLELRNVRVSDKELDDLQKALPNLEITKIQ